MRAPKGLRSSSLSRRLVLLALTWSLATLIITAVGLGLLFQRTAVRRVDETLNDLLANLIANSQVAQGQVYAPALTDERALRVFSGRYWELAQPLPGNKLKPAAKSHSLFDSDLEAPADVVARAQARPGKPVPYETRGPQGEPLRARAQLNLLQDTIDDAARPTPVLFLAGEDQTSVHRDITTFVAATSAMFFVLGAGLITAVIVQVRVGLRPLYDLQNEVAAVRRGKAQRVAETYPSELKPLAQELNALVAHNQEVVDRQRTHVGNLAHALKTPISVMVTEAGQRPGPLAEVVTRQADAMQKQVDHHLRRARAAARASGQGERTSVAEVLDELSRALGRIFRDKGVAIDWDADEELFFLGERQDLMEIAGNAIENACKFGRSRVRVRTDEISPERFRLTIEDDGPGLPADRRDEVLKRGARLDESAPGSGLGLSIVDELARAYGGTLTLGDSTLGGLRLEADLPRADA